MNKIFMTKRRHDGEIAVCSELTRSKGKMKSFVAAVATAAALATPVAEGATASAVIDTNTNDRQKFYATFYDYDPENDSYTPKPGYLSDPDDRGDQYRLPESFDEFLYGSPPNGYKPINEDKPIFSKLDPTIATSDETGLKDNYSNTLTFTKPGVKMQAAASWGNAFIINEKDVELTIQDTDNTSNVTSNTTALTVTPQNPVKYTDTNRGIGSNTEYKIDLNYNTTTLGLDDSGALTVIGGTGGSTTLPKTYFHVNGPGMKAGGDATTNLGEVDEYAGATGTSSIAAGVNAKATGASSVAVGAGATSGSGDRSVAVGASAGSTGKNATAVGEGAKALATQALALGSLTNASTKQSIAIGNDVEAKGYSSIAIGSDDTGTKTISTNKRDGANTEYSTFVYDAAQEEMVSNPYVKVEAKNAGKTGAPAALSYTATLTSADPNATGETKKSVVFALRVLGANSSKALTTAQQNLIKSLGLSLSGAPISANVYDQLTRNPNVILINADSSDEDIRAAVAFANNDPLNYRARLLAKFKAEALAAAEAAGSTLSDADANAAAQSSLEALASKMGWSSVDAYIKEFYNTYQKTTTDGVGAIAQGAKAIAMADGAVAIGTAASAMSRESLALGVATVTTGERAIGVGALAVASGDRSVAIGTYTNRPESELGETRYDSPRALGDDAVAIGAGAYVGVDVLGTKSVALGAGSIVTTGYGDLKEDLTTGEWVGTLHNYKSYDPNKTPGVNEKGETHKQFTRGNTTTGGSTGTVDKAYVGRIIYRDFAGATAVGAVSVGYSGAEKRIQNVAAGEISPTSTDAINGSQLYIATFETGYQIESSHFHTNDGTGTQEEGDTETNKGKLAETAGARSNYTTTAGIAARAVGEAAVAVGHHTLTGLTEAKYAEMVVIDKALAKHKEDRQKAQDKLEAANKTLDLADTRLPILQAELNNYTRSLQDLESKITAAAGNPDELARLTEQRAKMLASKQLIDDQITKLTTDQAQARINKDASEAEIIVLDGKIGEAKTQLANFLTANAKDHAVALGSNIEASGEKSVAIGKDVKVSGNQSIAVGYGNEVSGNNSGAFGDPSIVAGAGSYTQGNDNAVGSQAKNVGAFGNNNQIGATATYVDGKLQTASGLTNESAVENSRVVGNNNYINTNNTYVLGSGVGVKDDKSVLGTVANSVYLGNDSTAVATAGNNVDKDGTAGTTTTGGATGTVNTATVNGVTYNGFAGKTAVGAVTVGAAGEERRIQNVAAGEISKTSTDAINGSQLYMVAAKPIKFTANKNADSAVADKGYAAEDGLEKTLGETLEIKGANTSVVSARSTDDATAGDYSAKNIQTIVDDNGVQIQMAEKPEFKELTVKADNNDSNPVKITSGAGDTGGTISNLSTTLPDNSAQTAGTKPTSPTTTNAATLGDVLNAGWNLKENSAEKDFVTAYDTVDFVNGEGTTVNITSTNGVSKVKVDVNKGTIKTPTNGSLSNDAADDNKFTTVKNVVEAVNATYWNIHANGTAVNDGKVNPANTVNIRGKGAVNVTAGADSTTDAYNIDIELNTTTLADANTTSANGNTVTNTPDGKIDTPAEADKNKFVTAGDIANAINAAGWKAETTGNNLTAANTEGTTLVKAGDTVQFEAGSNLKVGRAGNKFTYELNPVLTNLTSAEFKDGTNVTKITPTGTTTTDGTTTTTVAPTEIKVGDKQGDTDTPITISSTTTDGNTKNVIDGLTNNLPETKNATDDTTTKTQDAPTDTAINNNAATVGDVLNAGWNLKAQDQAVDFVKPYDTVNIKGDGAIKVAGTNTDGATSTVTISVETTTLKDEKKAGDNNTLVDGKDGKVDAPAEGDKNKLVTAENIANAINNSGFTLKSSAVANQGEKLTGTQTGDEVINPGDVIEMVAGKNMTVKQDQNGKITYATKDNVEFNTVKVGTTGTGTDTKQQVTLKTENAKPATNNPETNKPTTALDIKSTDGKPTQITGVGSVLNTQNVSTDPDGNKTGGNNPTDTKLVNLGNATTPLSEDTLNSAATVRDIANMGWVVKATDNAYSDVVKNANEVNFVGTNLAKVTGETDTNGVRTITVDVNAQKTVEAADTPVVYTDADGNKLVKGEDGKFYKPADLEGATYDKTANKYTKNNADVAPATTVIASMNDGDNIANNPKQLSNVKGNLAPTYNKGDNKIGDGTNSTVNGKPTTEIVDTPTKSATLAPVDASKVYNNAATVGDVLNAGWNLQGNGVAKDFVKPYDTVNFVNGTGTTVDVTTDENGKVSNVKVNTLLAPTNLNGDVLVKGNDNNWYKASEVTNGVPNNDATVQNAPTSVKVVNPADNTTSNPTKLGNVASSLNMKQVSTNPTGSTANPVPSENKELLNLEGTTDAPVNKNAAATVGDLQNMGWVVRAQGNGYSDVVKNANEVEFRGEGIEVNGKTEEGKRVITIKPLAQVLTKLEAELVNNTGGTGTTEPSGKITIAPNNNAGGFATAGNVKDMINAAGWRVQENGTTKDLVKAGDKVNFVNGAGTTVSVTTAANGESSDVKVNIDTTTLINKDGKVVEPVTNAADLVKAIEDAKKELANAKTPEATAEANRKLAEAEKAADTAGLNKVVTAQNVAEAINKSGFTLKTSANGGEKISGDDELINPGDKVEMIAGKNLTVKQEANGKVTYATKEDVNFTTASIGKETFVKKDDPTKEVVKIGDKYYEKGVVEKDGKVYPADTDLTQVNDATPQASEIAADNVKLKDPTVNFERVDGRDTTHTPAGENAQPTTTNVDSALSVKDSNGNNSQINGIASALDTKDVATKPLTVDVSGKPVADKQTGKDTLVDLSNVNKPLADTATPEEKAAAEKLASSALTVKDAANMGWIVSASGNEYKDTVKNANQVDFVGTGLAKVMGETKNGIRTITVNVDAQKIVEAAQTPVVYTNENGEKLVKGENGKFYKPADLEGATYDKTANKYTKDNADVAPATTVIASMNDGNNRTTTPMVLSNVDGNLTPTYNKGDAKETDGKLGNTTADAPTKSQSAPEADKVKNMYNNAATVGDILNAGWNLQGNGSAVDFVKPYDTVNFVDGAGTKVDVSTDADGKVSTVKVNVDTVGLTNNANGGVENPTKAAQEALAAAKKALDEANAGTDEVAKEAAAKDVQAAQKVLDKANNQIATAQDVANAINDSGWNVIAEANGGVVSDSNKELVKPSETVSLKAGKNIEIAQDGQNFTFRTSANPEFNSVTVGEPAYQKADGTPVNKVGDKYYTADGQEVAAGDVVKATKPAVNMTAEAAKPATNNGNNQPSTALNITSADGKPTQITGVGSSLNTKAVPTSPTGSGGTTENIDLVDLVGTNTAPINKNAAATVGDLANMGWIVSATGNGYKDAVKNANQVDFVGTGLATVKGETKDGIRTITVDVNAQNTVESAQNPVVYTDANGNKVTKADDGNFYPADSVVIDSKRYPKGSVKQADGSIVDANGQAVAEVQPIAKGDIIASMNNGDNATKPTTLSNVGSNLTPTTSGDTLINKDGTTTAGQTPTKAEKAPTNAAKINNNAATVGDVLNAGWNLQGNGSAVDFVKPYDTVNFVDGVGTLVKATSDGATSVIQVDVDKGSINVNTTTGAVTPTNLTALDRAIADATKALDDAKAANPTDPNAQAIKDAEVALAKAEADKAKVLNKVATVEDVASALKNSGFTLKSSAVDTGTKLSGDDELINPGDTVEMVAGKNLTVKQEVNGKITYATKDDVNFNSVEVGKAEPTYKDKDGDELVKVGDNFYKKDDYTAAPDKADGTGKDLTNVDTATVDNAKSEAPVKLTSDKGVATKETTLGTDGKTETTTAKDAPSALSVKDSLGENSQINGIASALDTKEVATKPLTVDKDGKPVADKQTGKDKLVDLTAPTDAAEKAKWESSAVTVGDIANMGWVVSASDNGYTDTVKNANKVDFKGENGISVTGKTTADGVREITVSLEKGEVIGANEGTVKIDGKDTDVVKVGDEYFKKEDIDPTTGKPKEGTTALGNDVVGNNGENVVNNGNKLVDGHTVAKAIQESGFTVGKETDTSGVDFNNSDEKVNPNDELRFADGKGTTVSTGTVKTIDPNGEVSTKTVVKVDVDTGVITNNANGSLKGIVSAADAKKLNDDLAKAQDALAAIEKLGENAPQNVKDAAKAAVYDAEKAIEKAGLNKVATVQNVADAINQSGWNAAVANVGSGVSEDKGGDALVNPGDTVTMTAGNNMQITKDGLNYTIETQKDVTFNSVTADAVNIGPVTLTGRVAHNPDGSTTNELSVGSPSSPTRITNVAPGVNDTDAVNVSQLKGVQNNINQRFGDVYQKMDREHKGLRAGIAGAAALAGIPEVHVAGRSMIAAAASAYKSENAIAVGYSRLSDNSKIKLKLTGSANTRGDVMGTVGVGYMW